MHWLTEAPINTASKTARSGRSRTTRPGIKTLAVILGLLLLASSTLADTYDIFKTTRYYSPNRRYFVEVTKNQRAILYRNDRHRLRRQWTRVLPALPGRLLVANDGSRVAIIDQYYGNASDPNMPAVTILNERGKEIASYRLSDVADLSRVIKTTSAAQWYSNVTFTPDDSYLIIETSVAKRDPATCARVSSPEEAEECSRSVPYEQLRFATANGKLISRTRSVSTILRQLDDRI